MPLASPIKFFKTALYFQRGGLDLYPHEDLVKSTNGFPKELEKILILRHQKMIAFYGVSASL
jgi:hypothetical protein